MMAGQHPDELTLLAYVEGELRAAERGTLAAHVAACPACADSVRRLETAREALRSAPLFELPEGRRSALIRRLPERKERFGFLDPFRHGLARAAPALAALVLIGGIVAVATQTSGGDDEEGAEPALEAGGGEAEEQAGEGAETAPGLVSPQDAGRTLVQRVRGPAAEVAELLRLAGVRAVVRDGSVVARGDPADVRALLEQRPRGRVAVYARPR
jgi:anti-sigma factor RsiW